MTRLSKAVRLSFVCSFILSIAFVQVTSAQADPRYQYQQRSNGATSNIGTPPPMATADKKIAPLSPTQTIPFDGGLSLFVLAGAGIAAKKRYDRKKAKG